MRILPSGSLQTYCSSLLFNFGSSLLSPLLDRGQREEVVLLLPYNRPNILFLPSKCLAYYLPGVQPGHSKYYYVLQLFTDYLFFS